MAARWREIRWCTPEQMDFSAGEGATGDELTTVPMMTDIAYYLAFVLKMVIAFGVAFEIPIATMLIAMTGVSSADSMAHKRPYVIVGCFIVGMLLTPPDVVSQLLLAIPTWLLFELGILLARVVEKRTENSDG